MPEEKDSIGKIMGFLFILSLISFGIFIYRSGPKGAGIFSVQSSSPLAASTNSADDTNANTNAQAKNVNTNGKVLGAIVPDSRCGQRPSTSYGSCPTFLGVYYNGTTCVQVYGCDLHGDTPPFFGVGDCTNICVVK